LLSDSTEVNNGEYFNRISIVSEETKKSLTNLCVCRIRLDRELLPLNRLLPLLYFVSCVLFIMASASGWHI
jgi:hypothetical protein